MKKPLDRKQLTLLVGLIGIVLIAILAAVLWFVRPGPAAGRSLRFVTTIAGLNGEIGEPFGIAVRGDDIFVSDGVNGKIWKISRDKTSTFAEGFDTPSGIAVDQKGNLIVADSGANLIKSISTFGEITVLASGCGVSRHQALETGVNNETPLSGPIGVAVGDDGSIYFSDTYNDRICVIEKGLISTFAGGPRGFQDGVGTHEVRFDTPTGLAILGDNLLIADAGNRKIRYADIYGNVGTVAGYGEGGPADGLLSESTFVQPAALAVDDLGSIFVADGTSIRRIGGTTIPIVTTITSRSRGDADGPTAKASFNRPSGLAFAPNGDLIVADSENQLVRRISSQPPGSKPVKRWRMQQTAEDFRNASPPRWPYDPPTAKRDIAGTLGEIRGEMTASAENVWFHNGLDIAGAYGETARFIRDEKVLRPIAAENFGTLRELIRMPTLGYIHIRLGRNADGKPLGDPRFQFQTDTNGKLIDIRVPRGTKFKAGEPIGTLNPMNHVHLIAGRSGYEMNALDALILPGISDSRPPVIEKVTFYDQNGVPVETSTANPRIKLTGNTKIVAKAYDQMDGNAERRRLGVYKIGYSVTRKGDPPIEPKWTIVFDKMPSNEAVKFVYAEKSHSGATGETIFNYIVTNEVSGDLAKEGHLDAQFLASGIYTLQVFAGDYFGNISQQEFEFEVIK